MLYYNITLPRSQLIFPRRISECRPRVVKAMQLVRMHLVRLMPVIQEIIMEKRPTDQLPFITGNMKHICQRQTTARHTQHMVADRYISMLNKLFVLMKIS